MSAVVADGIVIVSFVSHIFVFCGFWNIWTHWCLKKRGKTSTGMLLDDDERWNAFDSPGGRGYIFKYDKTENKKEILIDGYINEMTLSVTHSTPLDIHQLIYRYYKRDVSLLTLDSIVYGKSMCPDLMCDFLGNAPDFAIVYDPLNPYVIHKPLIELNRPEWCCTTFILLLGSIGIVLSFVLTMNGVHKESLNVIIKNICLVELAPLSFCLLFMITISIGLKVCNSSRCVRKLLLEQSPKWEIQTLLNKRNRETQALCSTLHTNLPIDTV
eukprot:254416_1